MNSHNPESFNALNHREYQLKDLKHDLLSGSYPGYPTFDDRFVCDKIQAAQIIAGLRAIPTGPWLLGSADDAPLDHKRSKLDQEGYTLDSQGRPLHPWFVEMATESSIGVVTGRGAYWHWGPNYTADNIIVSNEQVLLIQRGDTGQWALPGGYVDGSEDALTTANRELEEETSLILSEDLEKHIVYKGVVADLRATAHAWPETTAVLIDLGNSQPEVYGNDDAVDARWAPAQEALESEILFGAHKFLLSEALKLRAIRKS